MDFAIGLSNMTWPGIAAVMSGFANLTAAGMRTTNVLNKQMTMLHAGMMAAGGGAVLVLGLMTAEAVKFEKEMKTVQSLIMDTGQSASSMGAQMAQLTSSAKNLALEYGKSPIEIAKGFEVLGRAGLNTAAQMDSVMRSAIQLSTIEGISIDKAATMTIQMTSLFGGDYAKDANAYATILAHAANISTTSAEQIMMGMQYVGGAAATVWGGNTEAQHEQNASNMAAAIATMSQQGVSGAVAGTATKSYINYLSKHMPKSEKALAKIGLSDKDFLDQNGQLIPMDASIEKMYTAMKNRGYSQYEMYQWLLAWGEPRQAQQYMKLFPQTDTTAQGWMFKSYEEKMKEQYNMQERVNVVMQSTSAVLDKLKASFEVFAINVGENILPPLQFFVDGLKMAVDLMDKIPGVSTVAAAGLSALALGGVYAVGNWALPLITQPYNRIIESMKGAEKGSFSFKQAIKDAFHLVNEEGDAAGYTANQMDKKAKAKERATSANRDLSKSAVNSTGAIKDEGFAAGQTATVFGKYKDAHPERLNQPKRSEKGKAAEKRAKELQERIAANERAIATSTAGSVFLPGGAAVPIDKYLDKEYIKSGAVADFSALYSTKNSRKIPTQLKGNMGALVPGFNTKNPLRYGQLFEAAEFAGTTSPFFTPIAYDKQTLEKYLGKQFVKDLESRGTSIPTNPIGAMSAAKGLGYEPVDRWTAITNMRRQAQDDVDAAKKVEADRVAEENRKFLNERTSHPVGAMSESPYYNMNRTSPIEYTRWQNFADKTKGKWTSGLADMALVGSAMGSNLNAAGSKFGKVGKGVGKFLLEGVTSILPLPLLALLGVGAGAVVGYSALQNTGMFDTNVQSNDRKINSEQAYIQALKDRQSALQGTIDKTKSLNGEVDPNATQQLADVTDQLTKAQDALNDMISKRTEFEKQLNNTLTDQLIIEGQFNTLAEGTKDNPFGQNGTADYTDSMNMIKQQLQPLIDTQKNLYTEAQNGSSIYGRYLKKHPQGLTGNMSLKQRGILEQQGYQFDAQGNPVKKADGSYDIAQGLGATLNWWHGSMDVGLANLGLQMDYSYGTTAEKAVEGQNPFSVLSNLPSLPGLPDKFKTPDQKDKDTINNITINAPTGDGIDILQSLGVALKIVTPSNNGG